MSPLFTQRLVFSSKPMHAHALVLLGISRSSLDYYQSHLLQFISHFLSLTNRLEDNHQVVENVFLNNIVSNFGPLNLLDFETCPHFVVAGPQSICVYVHASFQPSTDP